MSQGTSTFILALAVLVPSCGRGGPGDSRAAKAAQPADVPPPDPSNLSGLTGVDLDLSLTAAKVAGSWHEGKCHAAATGFERTQLSFTATDFVETTEAFTDAACTVVSRDLQSGGKKVRSGTYEVMDGTGLAAASLSEVLPVNAAEIPGNVSYLVTTVQQLKMLALDGAAAQRSAQALIDAGCGTAKVVGNKVDALGCFGPDSAAGAKAARFTLIAQNQLLLGELCELQAGCTMNFGGKVKICAPKSLATQPAQSTVLLDKD